uniref:DNA endonuclease activator Ctp1 C-terminal domain-containing protein n=1 Tax=Plectus sambesii TaxID=2011161 RepID=A0A914X2R6_9BILA
MASNECAERWTDWEADSLFDEEEKIQDLSGDMFDVSASPRRSPIVNRLSCDDETALLVEESTNQLCSDNAQLAATEQQKKTSANEQKPAIVIDLVDSPLPMSKAQPSSVWLSCRKKKQTRLDFYLRPSAVAHKALRPPLVPDVPSTSVAACQRSVNLLPTQAPPPVIQQETIEIDSSADELLPVEVWSPHSTSSQGEYTAAERVQLDATVAPCAPLHSTFGGDVLDQTVIVSALEQTIAASTLDQTVAASALDGTIAPESWPQIQENSGSAREDKGMKLAGPEQHASPVVKAPSMQIPSISFINAYDDFELPRRDAPKTGEVVRGKKDRVQLHGFDCVCCKNYYDGLNLSPKSREARINQISRHRAVEMMPLTPEHYWEVDMPDTQECIKRGYIKDSPYVRRQPKNWQPRRRRTKKVSKETDVA